VYDMHGLSDKDQEELQKGYRAATRGDSFTWIYFYVFFQHRCIVQSGLEQSAECRDDSCGTT
jgi:hypothetical protein